MDKKILGIVSVLTTIGIFVFPVFEQPFDYSDLGLTITLESKPDELTFRRGIFSGSPERIR